jgi:5-hydroxyisourate hydrolase-like protein (transthyretin family)
VQELTLKAPYPSPAGGRATVPFAVPEGTDAEAVRMRLYDVLGRRVRTVRATAEPGRHEVRLETGDLASGVYFLRLRAGETIRTRKVTIVR